MFKHKTTNLSKIRKNSILPEIYQDFTYYSDQIKPKIDDIVQKIWDKHLKVQVHAVLEICCGREALVLPHVVGHGEVAVGRFAFWQKHRIVEADVLVAGDSLIKK